MKTNPVLLALSFALAGLSRATEPARRACCAADAMAAAPTVALSSRSLYQLEVTWTDDAGRPVPLASLRGRPVVLAMFFASCEYACPIVVSEMQRLRETLPAGVREQAQFVLVSFDSARDTPTALQAYRARMKLADGAWTILRGEPADVQELAMLLGVKYQQDARGQFAHSNLITVLNAEGEIVQQRAGLQGDVSGLAKAVVAAAPRGDLAVGAQ